MVGYLFGRVGPVVVPRQRIILRVQGRGSVGRLRVVPAFWVRCLGKGPSGTGPRVALVPLTGCLRRLGRRLGRRLCRRLGGHFRGLFGDNGGPSLPGTRHYIRRVDLTMGAWFLLISSVQAIGLLGKPLGLAFCSCLLQPIRFARLGFRLFFSSRRFDGFFTRPLGLLRLTLGFLRLTRRFLRRNSSRFLRLLLCCVRPSRLFRGFSSGRLRPSGCFLRPLGRRLFLRRDARRSSRRNRGRSIVSSRYLPFAFHHLHFSSAPVGLHLSPRSKRARPEQTRSVAGLVRAFPPAHSIHRPAPPPVGRLFWNAIIQPRAKTGSFSATHLYIHFLFKKK